MLVRYILAVKSNSIVDDGQGRYQRERGVGAAKRTSCDLKGEFAAKRARVGVVVGSATVDYIIVGALVGVGLLLSVSSFHDNANAKS